MILTFLVYCLERTLKYIACKNICFVGKGGSHNSINLIFIEKNNLVFFKWDFGQDSQGT